MENKWSHLFILSQNNLFRDKIKTCDHLKTQTLVYMFLFLHTQMTETVSLLALEKNQLNNCRPYRTQLYYCFVLCNGLSPDMKTQPATETTFLYGTNVLIISQIYKHNFKTKTQRAVYTKREHKELTLFVEQKTQFPSFQDYLYVCFHSLW